MLAHYISVIKTKLYLFMCVIYADTNVVLNNVNINYLEKILNVING